ncbi:response regulator [Halorientalis halophila]|uniref:response regulator n=1 Tax=Halorientalis halophila TaxID=3108499 RepID=UPI00300A9754
MRDRIRSAEPADILLVEDNPGDIRLTQVAFEESRIANTLHVVTDGVAALDFLHQRGEYADAPRPDVVLLDLNLPRKDGDEVLADIGAGDTDLSLIPVIVLTSSKSEEDIVRSYDLQANAFLTKPVDPAEFIETIKRFEAFWLEVVRLPPEGSDRS